MKSSSAREWVEEDRVGSRVGNEGIWGRGNGGLNRPRDQNINKLDAVRE